MIQFNGSLNVADWNISLFLTENYWMVSNDSEYNVFIMSCVELNDIYGAFD